MATNSTDRSEKRSPRILIVRTSAIGDVIHGLPALCALREHFPHALLGWVVEDRAADLLRGHTALDELVTVPRKWLKSPSAVWQLRRRLRELEFDVAIDLQGLTKSGVAAWLSGARRRIGFGGPDARELSGWFYHERVAATAPHVIDRNLELLRPLGIENPRVEFNLAISRHARAEVRAWHYALGLGDRFAILNPGAGWPSKLWPTERYAAVARYLAAAFDMRSLVVWGGSREQAWAREIVRSAEGHAVAAPETTLGQLAALCEQAALFVGSDTGPLHLAAAVGTPCVGLYGPMPAERNGPYGAQHIALQVVCLRGSSRARRAANNDSMRAISVEQVCQACKRILADGKNRSAA